MTTFRYYWYRDTLVIYIWWHDQKCSRCWLFLNVRIPLHHLYHTLFPLFLHLEADFSWCSLLGMWCQAFIGVKGFVPPVPLQQSRRAAHTLWGNWRHSPWFLSLTAHHSHFHFHHSNTKGRTFYSKGGNFPYRVEFWYHILCQLHFITKAKEMYSSLR